jgi:hypothetical protein
MAHQQDYCYPCEPGVLVQSQMLNVKQRQYLEEIRGGKEYKGPTHKMDGQVHTGAKHTASSKVLVHKKPKKK